MQAGFIVALAVLSLAGAGAVGASGLMAPAQGTSGGMQGGMQGGYGGGMMDGGSGMYGGGMMGGGGCGCQNDQYCQQYMYENNYTWDHDHGMMP